MLLPHYTDNDRLLDSMLPQRSLIDGIDFTTIEFSDRVSAYEVCPPSTEYRFLHETAIIKYKGVLYASWYNCPRLELVGHTPIRGMRSFDDGKTWVDLEIIVDDPEGRILCCPQVYGIDDGHLYMLVNMMSGPDRMHGISLYILNEDTNKFEELWSREIPFKLNTNVVRLDNGKLMLPGRIAKQQDGFPNIPAALISDTGHIDSEWRLVYLMNDQELPDCSNLHHPETTAVVTEGRVYMFCRNDERNVPLIFSSRDDGEHWSLPIACDIPFSNSKIYAGTLSNGRNYVVGNLYPGRERLMLLLSKPGEFKFNEGILLTDGYTPDIGFDDDIVGRHNWHYPCAYEADGKLFIICTCTYDMRKNARGAVLFVYDIE